MNIIRTQSAVCLRKSIIIMFRHKLYKVRGAQKTLRNEWLYDLYDSAAI